MKIPWMGSLLVVSGLIVGSASAQEQFSFPTAPSPYGTALVTSGAAASGEGTTAPSANAAAPGQPVASVPSINGCGGECRRNSNCSSNLYGSFEFLWLAFKKQSVPALVTQGDPADTPTGALGQPGTTVLFGNQDFGQSSFGGCRFTVGYWLDQDRSWGVETSWLFVEQRKSFFSATSSGDPGTGALAVPFFNNDGGFEDANQVALENVSAGGIAVRLTQRAWGAELNLRRPCSSCDQSLRWTLLAGFRFLDLDESLDLQTTAVALPADIGILSAVAESHQCINHFYGGQIGAQADYCCRDWLLTVLAKVALGSNNERLNINGATLNIDPINGTVVAPGGIFTGPNNMGSHSHEQFAVVPELGVSVGRRLSDNLTVSVGYTFLYISDVIRPGNQIDRVVNFQSNDRPAVLFKNTDFWMQGVSLGIRWNF